MTTATEEAGQLAEQPHVGLLLREEEHMQRVNVNVHVNVHVNELRFGFSDTTRNRRGQEVEPRRKCGFH